MAQLFGLSYRFSGERPAYFSDSAHFRYEKILCWTNSLLFVNNEETLGENYEDWLSALWIAILTLLKAIYIKAYFFGLRVLGIWWKSIRQLFYSTDLSNFSKHWPISREKNHLTKYHLACTFNMFSFYMSLTIRLKKK